MKITTANQCLAHRLTAEKVNLLRTTGLCITHIFNVTQEKELIPCRMLPAVRLAYTERLRKPRMHNSNEYVWVNWVLDVTELPFLLLHKSLLLRNVILKCSYIGWH